MQAPPDNMGILICQRDPPSQSCKKKKHAEMCPLIFIEVRYRFNILPRQTPTAFLTMCEMPLHIGYQGNKRQLLFATVVFFTYL